MSIYKLISISETSEFIPDILKLISHYRKLLFADCENYINDFYSLLQKDKIKIIGAIKDEKLFAFLALYDFRKISKQYFSCYIYGASRRKFAKQIEFLMPYIFNDLKNQGCKTIKFETHFYNLPMRFLARRLGFRRVGILKNSSFLNGKFIDNILYEKTL